MGYLLKDRIMDIATLVDSWRRLTEGETVIDPTIVSKVMGRRRDGRTLVGLSARKVEVLSLIAEGLSNRSIAKRLVINDRTVDTHIAQIFVKHGRNTSPGGLLSSLSTGDGHHVRMRLGRVRTLLTCRSRRSLGEHQLFRLNTLLMVERVHTGYQEGLAQRITGSRNLWRPSVASVLGTL